MDLFEILFIALFILFPILDGILKQRKKRRERGPAEGGGADDAGWSDAAEEPRSASEMLPDDLWEMMAGERRQGGVGGAGAGSSSKPAGGGRGATGTLEDWSSEPEPVSMEYEVPEPVTAEYEGPEAYTLETPAPEPIERSVPSAEARHRAFHELVDRPQRRRKRRVSPIMASLRSPDGLRQAVLLKEILGPPKGLE